MVRAGCPARTSLGITRSFPRLYPTMGLVTVALLTLPPLALRPVRLACLIHAANVHSEPGSNPSKSGRERDTSRRRVPRSSPKGLRNTNMVALRSCNLRAGRSSPSPPHSGPPTAAQRGPDGPTPAPLAGSLTIRFASSHDRPDFQRAKRPPSPPTPPAGATTPFRGVTPAVVKHSTKRPTSWFGYPSPSLVGRSLPRRFHVRQGL